MQHVDYASLEAGLEHIRLSPRDDGRLELIVRRPAAAERETIDEGVLDPAEGLRGDCWRTRGSSSTPDGAAEPRAQLTLMNYRVAALVAREPGRIPLAGDQLYVDLDLSSDNLPAGTRLLIGSAVVEISELPHTGCRKFFDRFGKDAHRFISAKELRPLNLRGVNAIVVEGGAVRTGDAIRKAAA